jgi:hypothetical protein
MRNFQRLIYALLSVFAIVCLTTAFAGKAKLFAAPASAQTVNLTVRDALGRLHHLTTTRTDTPPFTWSADGKIIEIEIQTDRLSCSGFGE